jgi:hypothetical protein
MRSYLGQEINATHAHVWPPHSMFEQAFKNIDDILRKESGCTTELDYTEQTSWLLFLKYLDALDRDKATEAQIDGKKYTHILVWCLTQMGSY